VLCGGTEKEELAAFELCDAIECLPLTKDDAKSAADLRRKNCRKLSDAFKAAVALRHSLRLVTRNARDFDEKKHGFVLIPYRLG